MPRICDFKKPLKRTKVTSAKLLAIDEDSYLKYLEENLLKPT
jgi:hypothetical protein